VATVLVATTLLLLLVPAALAATPVPAAASKEVAALLLIRSGFTNGKERLPDWTSTAESPCAWVGVECDPSSGAVISL
jgi:hypothetical protein